MSKIILLQLAGFGDTLSLLSRVPNLIKKYPKHDVKFYFGGIGKSPIFSKEQAEREGYEATVIKGLNVHGQLSN